ncbi:MAG: M1 family metallopeptidase [Chlorobi bacterium]|nr:M1 family metallopeptidase [Chlorobiota bacterium]
MKSRIIKIVMACIGLFYYNLSVSQNSSLFIPRDIQKTYDAKTRDFSGQPGLNYWQNRADYNIQVELTPKTRLVSGSETIKYYNNSPDTLKNIYFHLYQDIYKKGNFRDMPLSPDDITNGVTIKKVFINDSEVIPEKGFKPQRSILSINLPEPVLPSSNIEIKVNWEFTMPHISNVRMGTYDKSTFMVAYWYPALVVYDDIDGWSTTPFTGTQEFYNEFGSYNVKVTVPANYVVWATGVLQNTDKVLNKKYVELIKTAKQSDEIVHIIAPKDSLEQITLKKKNQTWEFKADYISEFAFATSNHYLWDATSLVVDSVINRRILVQAAYNRSSKDFYNVAEIARKSISYFSYDMPGIAFPYPQLTVFNGGGGMEFPMMVNDGSFSRPASTVHVTSHEILHSYLPFYMGINEQKYAWMDEGWAVMLPFEFQQKEAAGYLPKERLAKSFNYYSGNEEEVPPIVLSSSLSGKSYYGTYRIASYTRPAFAYEFLKDMLGKDRFKEAMGEYVKRWNGKHPIPYDFFFTFDDFTNDDLSWYWKPWFFEQGYPDLAIDSVSFENNICTVFIEKKGNLPLPVQLKFTFENEKNEKIYFTADVWKSDKNIFEVKKKFDEKPIKIELGNSEIPDVNTDDNYFEF